METGGGLASCEHPLREKIRVRIHLQIGTPPMKVSQNSVKRGSEKTGFVRNPLLGLKARPCVGRVQGKVGKGERKILCCYFCYTKN